MCHVLFFFIGKLHTLFVCFAPMISSSTNFYERRKYHLSQSSLVCYVLMSWLLNHYLKLLMRMFNLSTRIKNFIAPEVASDTYYDCNLSNLDMTKLCCLNPWVGNWNWATSFQSVEEPLFNRIVVQRSIDIDWPQRSPINTPWF